MINPRNWVAIVLIRAGYTVASAKRAAAKAQNVCLYVTETGLDRIDFSINHGNRTNYSFVVDPATYLVKEYWQHVEPGTEHAWTSFEPVPQGPVGRSGVFDTNMFTDYTTDELVDLYCDWGAMGENMDCDEEVWNELCEELERRGEIPKC